MSDCDDDNVLFRQVSEDGEDIEVPCSVATEFFHAELCCESYAPRLKFAVDLSVLGASRQRVKPDIWCTFSGVSVQEACQLVEAITKLHGVEMASSNFLRCHSLPAQVRELPGASVLCQLFAMSEAWRLRPKLDNSFAGAQELICTYFDVMCEELAMTSSDLAPLFSVTEVLPRVFHVETATRLVLGSTFVRFQEHYESQHADFRNKSFTLTEFRDWYRDSQHRDKATSTDTQTVSSSQVFGSHGWNFYLAWPGFNLPSRVLFWCRDNMAGGMRPHEQALLDAVLPLAGGGGDGGGEGGGGGVGQPFYVIGTCLEDRTGGDATLHHELAHGLFATNEEYRAAVKAEVTKLPQAFREELAGRLYALGYCDDLEIVMDEIQAYLVGGDLLEEADRGMPDVPEVQGAVRAIWERFAGLQVAPDS